MTERKFIVMTLTPECMKALETFAAERAEALLSHAEFVPTSSVEERRALITRKVINAVKQTWMTPDYETTCFTELPRNLVVPMYETRTITGPMDAFTLMQGQSRRETPMFEWGDEFLAADTIPEILTYKEVPALVPDKEGDNW